MTRLGDPVPEGVQAMREAVTRLCRDANYNVIDARARVTGREEVASLLEKNPVLALDYLKRAFLISGDERLRTAAQALIGAEGLDARAKNSVERLAASF